MMFPTQNNFDISLQQSLVVIWITIYKIRWSSTHGVEHKKLIEIFINVSSSDPKKNKKTKLE